MCQHKLSYLFDLCLVPGNHILHAGRIGTPGSIASCQSRIKGFSVHSSTHVVVDGSIPSSHVASIQYKGSGRSFVAEFDKVGNLRKITTLTGIVGTGDIHLCVDIVVPTGL